jgi:uncharacterized protein (TIGR03435 family)
MSQKRPAMSQKQPVVIAFLRRVYRTIIHLHPAPFRAQFGREMALDYEDALHTHSLRALWRDALLSLPRQWTAHVLTTAPDPIAVRKPSLLAGDYIMIRDKAFTPLELSRGLAATVALLALCAITLNAGAARQPDTSAPQGSSAQSSAALQPEEHAGILHASGARPSFEVATIRPSAPGAELRLRGITMQPDSFRARGSSIKDVIEFAYAIPSDNALSGGPSWIRTEQFDIMARPDPAEASVLSKLSDADLRVQMQLMAQSLLEERFHLKVIFATKDLPMFVLEVAKGGFKCTNAAPDAALASMGSPRYSAIGPPPPPPPPPGYVPPAPGHEPWREQPMHWIPHGWPFSLIVASIARQPELDGRMVVDKTRLDGIYNCDLTWSHEGTDVPGPSFFTSLQEQMGLKLQPEHGPVETIVIDHIDRPSEN